MVVDYPGGHFMRHFMRLSRKFRDTFLNACHVAYLDQASSHEKDFPEEAMLERLRRPG